MLVDFLSRLWDVGGFPYELPEKALQKVWLHAGTMDLMKADTALDHPYISDAAAAILPRVLKFLAHDRCGDIWDRCDTVERLQWLGLAHVALDDTITIRPWEKLPAHTRQQLAQWLARSGSLFARLAHLSARANG